MNRLPTGVAPWVGVRQTQWLGRRSEAGGGEVDTQSWEVGVWWCGKVLVYLWGLIVNLNSMGKFVGTLKPGTKLTGGSLVYTIVDVLGQGGCGITYLVTADVPYGNLVIEGVKFAIKEHFVKDLCDRDDVTCRVMASRPVVSRVNDSKRAFIKEAGRLEALGIVHPNVIKINEVFEANDTAYYVMEFLDGVNLREYVSKGCKMTAEERIEFLLPVIDAVECLHRNRVTHLDIYHGCDAEGWVNEACTD